MTLVQRSLRSIPVLLIAAAAFAVGVAGPALAAQTDPSEEDERPVTLVVNTVPAAPDYPIDVDGQEYRTGPRGVLVIQVEPGEHAISVDEVVQVDEDTRILFNRWHDIWDRERIDSYNRSRTLTLGLLVQHRMGFAFTDALGEDVPAADIQSMILMNSNGDQLTLTNEAEDEEGEGSAGSIESVWLTANRLKRTGAGLLSGDAIYVYREINLDGRNVVQSGAEKFVPEPGVERTVGVLVFPLEVEVHSFVYNRSVSGRLALYNLDAAETDEPIAVTPVEDGLAAFPRLPRGDYEVVMMAGGSSPRSPVILTGPKVERITVVTEQLWWLVMPLVVLLIGSGVLFAHRPGSRIPLLIVWAVVFAIGLSTPSIGSVLNRPLSASAEPIYSASGDFVGIATEVRNRSPLSISQSYCRPDFELRIISDQGVWAATFESHDFHDVEFGECQVHKISPGTSRNVFSPFQGQEWLVPGGPVPPPGQYEALVRVFGVPAEPISVNVVEGFLEGIVAAHVDDALLDENPYTNPFED